MDANTIFKLKWTGEMDDWTDEMDDWTDEHDYWTDDMDELNGRDTHLK